MGVTGSFAYALLLPLYVLSQDGGGGEWANTSCHANNNGALLLWLPHVSPAATDWLRDRHKTSVDRMFYFLAAGLGPTFFIAGAFCTPRAPRTRIA